MPDRTTVVLPPRLKQMAMEQARKSGISFGEFVRRAVQKEVAMPPRANSQKTGDPFWDNLVAYEDDGPKDLAARHDDYLYGGGR